MRKPSDLEFQNVNKMSKNSGEFIGYKIKQIWTFSEPRRYKTDAIDKKQLFRIFIHNKIFSNIIRAKRNLHTFSLQLF